jgi:hypothetical protein
MSPIQQPSGTAPTTVSAPPAPVLAGGSAGNTYTITVPRTQEDMQVLRERRGELSRQLESAAARRGEIAGQLTHAEGAVKAGLEQQLAVLNPRILQLESHVGEIGRLLGNAPAELLATTEERSFADLIQPHTVEKVSVMFTLFVLAPLAVGAAFLMFRRAIRPAPQRGQRGDDGERLQRLETAVDAIAVEIERISEGQRFVTRLLTEAAPQSAFAAREQTSRIGARSESD